MSLSKLSEKCRKCPKVDTCDHKKMEALGLLPGEPTMDEVMKKGTARIGVIGMGGAGLAISAFREGMSVSAQADSKRLTDEIYKQINSQLGVSSSLLGGYHGKE